MPGAAPPHPMAGHVLGRLGVHVVEPDDPCGPGMHLHLAPALLDADGHVDFGVLGVFLDMASVEAGVSARYIHADISVHRLARPRGSKLFVDVHVARRGRRSAVVHLDVRDETGVRVAYSGQQLRFPGDAEMSPAMLAAVRKFFSALDGVCRLDRPLHESLGLETGTDAGGAPVWRLPLTPSSRNSFNGLHGGVTFALVGDAAAGAAAAHLGPARTTGALLRYLAPGMAGPFRAVPDVMPQDDGSAFVRVEVYDEGASDQLIVLGEANVVARA